MDSTPRDKLRQLIDKYGSDVGKDSRRCEAMLRDVCGSFRKEIFALTAAVKEGIPEGIRGEPADVPLKMILAKYASQMHADLGLSEDICQWTIESWAYAVGRATKRELRPETRCPECDTYIQIPAKLNGKPAKCPRCDTRLMVSADGSSIERRVIITAVSPQQTTGYSQQGTVYSQQATPSQLAADKQNDGGTQLGIVVSETADDMFGQIVCRMISNRGQLAPADYAQLEHAWHSLGLHPTAAMRIIQGQVAAAGSVPRNTFPQMINRHRPAPVMSSGAWHVRTIDGGHFGPLDDEMIVRWHAQGQIAPTALIWREGWTEWYPSAQVTIPQAAAKTQSTHSAQAQTTTVRPPPSAPPATQPAYSQQQPAQSPFAQSPFAQSPFAQSSVAPTTPPGPAPVLPPVPHGLQASVEGLMGLCIVSIALGILLPPMGFLIAVFALAQVGGLRAKLLSYDASGETMQKLASSHGCAIAGLLVAVSVSAVWGLIAIVVISGA